MDSGQHNALDTNVSSKRLNSEVLINKLPNELLTDIFARLRQSDIFGAKWGIAPDILQLTHVCTRWRTLALAQPELWTAISVNNLDIAQELAGRSGTLPISVSLHEPRSEDPGADSDTGMQTQDDINVHAATRPIAMFVVSQLHRVRELCVSLKSSEQLYIFLSHLARHPAPLLDVLFLELQGAVGVEPSADHMDLFKGPIFAGTAPPLRTLTLVHVYPALARLYELSGLVHLELTLLRVTLDRLMQMFASSPRLQTITLAITFIILGQRSQETPAVADLPDLRQVAITVSAYPEGARTLLMHLGIPPRGNLRVAIRNEILGYHVIPRVATLGCLAGILRVECTLRLQDKTFTLRAFREASPPSPSRSSISSAESECAPALEVSFHFVVGGGDSRNSLESLLRNWPMDVSRVEAYTITGFRGGRRDVWLELLRPFGALRRLRLAELDSATMVQVAGALGTMDGEEFYALPELRAVECVRLPPPEDGCEWLYQALLRRACAGKLQEATMEDVAGWDMERAARLAEETSGRLAVRCV